MKLKKLLIKYRMQRLKNLMSKWESKDNSETIQKAAIRKYLIANNSKVLDLFCGNGIMYELAYKDNPKVIDYIGVDKNKIHDEKLCYLQDNMQFIQKNNISEYNVFDLDAYGCPWKLLFHIMLKNPKKEVVFFLTDGLTTRMKMSNYATDLIAATEKIPKGFKPHGIYRFYVDIFKTMLLRVEEKTGYKTTEAKYFNNNKGTVYYWYLKFKKLDISTGKK
jgi:SAM-dependent methyltransferase